ncbi:iron-containing alcohol dehydrogenase [Nocardiopsis sp. MG754419]|uniref:iron-containing alcohol dehydrogenase n=1 Tax=Nocardiopsis sp. MG754419 TaxID=2259865 RepID=UPI001BA8E72E|nr:iron-containing alcohol dehydrogenase [Nocardiopsis sp. MG754419]MBR8740366.1 iron-containing alcohol dehydrogenase [Nocardiopsis sp. MG754419]
MTETNIGVNPHWWVPTRIDFGPGRLSDVPMEVERIGRPAAVVVDEHALSAVPALAALLERLAPEIVVRRAATTPTRQEAMELAGRFREAGVRSVCAIGGGTIMDLAKAAAAAAVFPRLLTDWQPGGGFVLPAAAAHPALPVVAVPTTAATGSEVNAKASLADGPDRRFLVHWSLFPRVAVIDPELHTSLPSELTAEGALETVARLLVPMVSDLPTTPLVDEVAIGQIKAVIPAGDRAIADGGDLEARGTIALAASVSTFTVHQIGRHQHSFWIWYPVNTLTAQGLRKGPALGVLLTRWARLVVDGDKTAGHADRLAELGGRALGCSGPSTTPAEAADALVTLLRRWGFPTEIEELGLTDSAEELTEQTWRAWSEPLRPRTREHVRALFEGA